MMMMFSHISPYWMLIIFPMFIFSLMIYFLFLKLKFNLTIILLVFFCNLLGVWFLSFTKKENFNMGLTSFLMDSYYIIGFLFFMFTEVMFFVGLFWNAIHNNLSNNNLFMWTQYTMVQKGSDSLACPLFNSFLLLISSITMTFAHNVLIKKSNFVLINIIFSWVLGVFFIMKQYEEYSMFDFMMFLNVYLSSFFFLTGFHGLHVCIGAFMMSLAFIKLLLFMEIDTFFFNIMSWYWHFVDLVWLVVFVNMYL